MEIGMQWFGESYPTKVSDPTEQERELFARGKEVCGKKSGGLILKLLKSKGNNVALARSVIELASTKQDPREFIAAAVRSGPNGNPIATAFDNLLARVGDEGPRDDRMRDITPRRP